MEGHQSISFDSPQLLLVAMYLTTVLSLIVLVAAAECIPLNQVETQRNARLTLRSILTNFARITIGFSITLDYIVVIVDVISSACDKFVTMLMTVVMETTKWVVAR